MTVPETRRTTDPSNIRKLQLLDLRQQTLIAQTDLCVQTKSISRLVHQSVEYSCKPTMLSATSTTLTSSNPLMLGRVHAAGCSSNSKLVVAQGSMCRKGLHPGTSKHFLTGEDRSACLAGPTTAASVLFQHHIGFACRRWTLSSLDRYTSHTS